MKKTTKLKAFMLSLMMAAMMLPATVFAQNDNYFTTTMEDDNNMFRDGWGFDIVNDDFGAPLGSGLLILTAVGAGYAVSRRKRNFKKGTTLLLAALMLVGMTNCRKNTVDPIAQPAGSNKVAITLNLGGGAKAEVDPPHVYFKHDDQILVASGGHYVGTLTATQIGDNVTFSGTITDPVVGEPLYFYFLGNKIDVSTLTPGASGSTTCTVNISDQYDYPYLPVISMAPSFETFNGPGDYSAHLLNKCSLMEFSVTSTSTAAICITGMNNKVTVDFGKLNKHGTGLAGSDTDEGFSYSKDTEVGFMKLSGKDGNGKTYAIVLPQTALTTTGEAYTIDGYEGTRPALPALGTDEYYKSYTITMSGTQTAWDGDLSKLTNSSTAAFATAKNGMRIYNSIAAGVKAKVSIADGATVTLDGATITYTVNGADYAGLTCLGDATIVLADGTTNTIVGGLDGSGYSNWPGIFVPAGSTLTINGNTGVLNAARGLPANDEGSPAGIGAAWGSNCGNIVINGGVINATGGNKGAGIGGCGRRGCGNITINGGTVTAISGDYAAGIGLGGTNNSSYADGGTCGDITISGGIIIATGGVWGAGIGTGFSANTKNVTVTKTCGNILISGGTITATGGNDAAGIGTGKTNTNGIINIGTITITNGVTLVTATKGTGAPNSIGKGSGTNITCGTVTIGGTVYPDGVTTSPFTYQP